VARFGKGKPMDQQASSLLAKHLDLSSRHKAKQELGIKGAQPTGKIHSLRTFQTYSSALTQAGRWAQEHHGIRHLKSLTPTQAQSYLRSPSLEAGRIPPNKSKSSPVLKAIEMHFQRASPMPPGFAPGNSLR
jgi:hypothetical protein